MPTKPSLNVWPAKTAKSTDKTLSPYERQHHLHRDAERLSRLAKDPKLSPDAAAAVGQLADGARKARMLMDHHVIGMHFPDSMSHHWRNAHSLLAQLRRDGDDSPKHVKRMLRVARQAAAFLDRGGKPRDQQKPPKDSGSRNWYS